MKINARFRLQILVQNGLFVVLLVAIVGAVVLVKKDV